MYCNLNILKIYLPILCMILTRALTTTSEFLPITRIAGGDAIDISEAKFVVQVITRHWQCGGSLVTPLHVITAAHCVDQVNTSDLTIIGGATYFNIGGIQRSVYKIYVPEKRVYKKLSWDIAVLKLSTHLKGPNIETIELCNTQWKTGGLFKVYGWGYTKEEEYSAGFYKIYNLISRPQLQVVEVPALGYERCKKHLNHILPTVMFCAGVPGEKDSCDGDSGGPAVYNNQLCGVVSAGRDCPDVGIYVNINYVRDFIEAIIKLDKI